MYVIKAATFLIVIERYPILNTFFVTRSAELVTKSIVLILDTFLSLHKVSDVFIWLEATFLE